MVLVVVSLLVPAAERFRLPHTVLLAIAGMAMGFLGSWVVASGLHLGAVGDAFVGLDKLEVSAELFLPLFLPPLLFTAGLNIEVRRLMDEISAVLLLAIVAVVVCIAFVGLVVRRGPLLLVGALLIVAVFGFVVWNAYRDGLAGEETGEAPELSTAGAFKTPPRAAPEVTVIAEDAEPAPGEVLDGAAAPAEAVDEVRPVLPAAKPVEAAPAPAPSPVPSKVMAPPPQPLKQPAPAVAPPAQQAAPKPAPATVAAAPTAVQAPGAYKPAFSAYGDHVVQIAATSSEGAALAEWNKLTKAYPDLLTGGEKFIQQADVNGKTVYRVRVGSFASKADASQFCAAFKAKGGNCYPAVK